MSLNKTLYLIDASSYIYRAFYALPKLTNSKGFPTNAIYGFINMIKKLLKEKQIDYLAVAFDHKGPTFRHKKFAAYKIARKPMPESLIRQLPIIKEIVQSYNIFSFEEAGYEADDILAYVAREAKKKNFEVYIVSPDKDILQVIDDSLYVLNPQKNIVLDKFKIKQIYGIEPYLFSDFLSLMGDKADNIPGLPGIGEKTALELVSKFGSVKNILNNIDKLPPKIKTALQNNKKQLLLSKELTDINVDLNLKVDFEKLRIKKPDIKKLISIFDDLEFPALIKDLLREITPDLKPDYKIIPDTKTLIQLLNEIKTQKIFAFYLNKTKSSTELLLSSRGKIYLLKKEILEQQKDSIAEIFSSSKIEKISSDIKEEIKILKTLNIKIVRPTFDIKIVAYLLNPSWGNYDFLKIALYYLESNFKLAAAILKAEENKSENKALIYLDVLNKSYNYLKPKIDTSGLSKLYYQIEEPLIFVLSDMEERGITVERSYLEKLLEEYKIKLDNLSQEIFNLAGEEFNINSPKQLGKILFDKLKLKPLKKRKTGPSTDEETLRHLSKEHSLPVLLLKYRELNKIKTSYLEGLLNCINPQDSKIHTTFNQTITQTGRLSSSNPNLQTLPVRSELGRQIRKAFIPVNKDYLFLAADYSQIELRILAHLSQDKILIDAFRNDLDIHKHTAALIFGGDEKIVSEEMRSIAKTVNFGIIYGISAYGLSKQLNISSEEASNFIEFYFKLYPEVKTYIERTIQNARKKGYVLTLFNRIRYLPEINSQDINIREFGERLAINTPIQGTAADLIKKVMVDIDREIKARKLKAYILLQIHDELIFEVEAKKINLLKELVRDKMENVLSLEVPLKVTIKTGHNWLELKKDEEGGSYV